MVNEWTIYGNDGAAKAVVKELELHDEWMAECFITVTVKSAEPIDFAIGDYITYRDEKYSINYDPTIIKKAQRGSYGEGFVYDNIKFAHDAQNKVVTCDFTDIVLNDNNLHYTSLPTFPFFCESVDDLLDRIQACLEELYPGEFIIIGLNSRRNKERGILVGREQAFIDAYKEYVDPAYDSVTEATDDYGKQNVALTVDNITCWDAVTKIHEDFELNFIQRGYVIVAGTSGALTPRTFRYGRGNGLYELERICDSSQQIVTRLRAYGNETNIPNRYYANLNTQCFGTAANVRKGNVSLGSHYTEFEIDLDFLSTYFKSRSVSYAGTSEYPAYIVQVKVDDVTVMGRATRSVSNNKISVYSEWISNTPEDDCDEPDMTKMDAFINAISNGSTVYFVSYINKDAWPTDHKNTSSENLPNNMAVNRLMLPGFPNQSLYDWVKANGGTDTDDETGLATINGFTGYFSKDKHRPYIDSLNRDEYGLRPVSIYFDGNGETTDIHPTIEEMMYGGIRIDEIVSADQITDNGVYDTSDPKNFKITLPDLGFDLSEVYKDGASIDMKDGMCGARSFKMASRPKKNSSGRWECTVQRAHDDSLDLWFPYNAFQLHSGDHYVLIGIDMPDAYVNAAAEKLFNAAIEALQKNDKPTYTYQPRIDEIWMQRQHDASVGNPHTSIHDTIKAGDIFAFEDDDLGIDGSIIIDVLTIKENGNNGLPTYEVTLRDEKQVSTIQKMIDKAVTSSSNNSGGSGSAGGYTGRQVQDAIENYGSDFYLSKTDDDTASGVILFLKGLWVKAAGLFGFDAEGNLSANEGNFSGRVTANDMRSPNYTGDGIADTGWAVTNDNGSGSSQAVFDYLTIRKKMIVNSLEIKETHVTAGDIAQTCASAELARTDYFEVDDQGNYTLLGYAKKKIPWYLKGLAIVLGKDSSRSNFLRMLGHYKEIRVTLTAADLSRCNRIRCYFLAKDGEREIENWFRVNDLVRCQTWNVTNVTRQTYTPDFNDHAGNVFWWRKCVDTSWNTGTPQYFDRNGNKTTNEAEAYVNEGGIARLASNGTYSATVDEAHAPKVLDGNTYHWIDVAYDYEAEQNAFRQGNDTGWCAKDSDIPALGDKVVQFGNSTDPDRMNITLSEVNGSGNIDAPDIKMYRGVYTFSLEKSWWGGVPCKMKLSPSTGYEFFGPHFKFTTEYGEARVPFDRAEKYWTSIAFERDEYHEAAGYEYPSYSDDILDQNGSFVSRADGRSPKNYVRKCYYYDRLTHNGSLWLCSMANETWYWRATVAFSTYAQGDKVTNYESLPDDQKALCEHVRNYTNQEPSVASGDWTQQVDKGDAGAFKSRVFCRTNTRPNAPSNEITGGYNTADNPVPPQVSGQPTWTDGDPGGSAMLWSSTAWFYSDGTHSNWTTPASETDTETLDIEFSPNYYQPSNPVDIAPSNRGNGTRYGTVGTNSRANGSGYSADWYDPYYDRNNGYVNWSNMIWRAERKIKNGEYIGSWSVSRIKGEGSIRVDLDNEMDSMLYDGAGNKLSGNIVSNAHLYDGTNDKTSSASWRISASGCTISSTTGSVITVTAVSSTDATVTVTATYNSKEYSAIMSIKKIVNADKFDLDISPNALFLNTSDGWGSSKTITIKVMRTPAGGGTPTAVNPSTYDLSLNASVGTISGSGTSRTLTITQTLATNNDGTTVTLYKSNLSNVYDRETIPFNKAMNGSDGKYTVTHYALSDSRTTHPAESSSDWSTDEKTPTEAKPYVWQRTRLYDPNTGTWATGSSWVYVCLTGDQGPEGIEGNAYDLVTSPTQLLYNPTTTNFVGVSGFTVSRINNGKASTDGSVAVYPIKSDGTRDSAISPTSSGVYNANSSYIRYDAVWTISSVVVATASVLIVKYGETGSVGHVGRFYYYAGDYSASTTYTIEDTQAPYVKYNGKFYMLDNSANGSINGSWSGKRPDLYSSGNPWTKMTSEQEYYIAKAVFADQAYLGAFVINGDWMISQYGTGTLSTFNGENFAKYLSGEISYYSGFKPNFAVDGKTGKTYQSDAYITGSINATSGNIGGFGLYSDRFEGTNDGQTVKMSPSQIYFKKGSSQLSMTATNFMAYNGYVEIVGNTGSNDKESLYVGGRAKLRSLAVEVGSLVESTWLRRRSFVCGFTGSRTLPSDPQDGEILFFKGGYNTNVTIYAASGQKIMVPWDSGLVDSLDIEQWSAMFIYAGYLNSSSNVWVAFKCG